jgi:hypothetical protein
MKRFLLAKCVLNEYKPAFDNNGTLTSTDFETQSRNRK